MLYAYNVYVGKFWDGEWYTATRKYAVPIDLRFEQSLVNADIRQLTNLIVVHPTSKPPRAPRAPSATGTAAK